MTLTSGNRKQPKNLYDQILHRNIVQSTLKLQQKSTSNFMPNFRTQKLEAKFKMPTKKESHEMHYNKAQSVERNRSSINQQPNINDFLTQSSIMFQSKKKTAN